MDMLQLNIVRKRQFYGFLMPVTVSISDKESGLICRKRIMSWKPVRIQLPQKDYIIAFSNKMLFARTVSSSVLVYGAVEGEVQIAIEINHIQWLCMLLPFLGCFTPLFDYRILTTYLGKNTEIQETKKRKLEPLTLPFGLLGIFSAMEIGWLWVNQLFTLNVEIEQWALEGTDEYTLYTITLWVNIVGAVLLLPVFAIIFMLSFLLVRNINMRKQCGEWKSVNENAPSILYLRPFEDDKFTSKQMNMFLRPGISEEEVLVSVLDDIAPVLCIGRPGKKYLPDGAMRITVPNDMWKESVARLIQKAELVVLRLGRTDGVLWELQYCLENLDLSKLVFILPNFENVSDWDNVKDVLKRYGIDSTPFLAGGKRKSNKGSIGGFFYFNEHGQAVYRPLRLSRIEAWIVPLEDKIKEALAALSVKYGLRVEARKSRRWAITFLALSVLVIVITILNAHITFESVKHGRFPKDLINAGQKIENVGEVIDGWDSKEQTDYLFFLFLNGLMYQEDENIKNFYEWHTDLMNCINYREYELLMECADGYPTRYLTLAKKYCSDEEYSRFIEYSEQCMELFLIKREELPQVNDLDEKAREALVSVLEGLPLYSEDSLSLEEWFVFERQFRAAVLEVQSQGYDLVPEMRSEFAEIRVELYRVVMDSE